MNEDFNSEKEDNNKEEEHLTPEQRLNPTMSPMAAGFIGLITVFVLYQIGGSLITLIIFGFDLESANITAMRLMTIGGQVLFILLPALLFAKLIYEDVTTIIRFRLPNFKEVIVFVIGLAILTPLLQSYLYVQNYLIEQLAAQSHFLTQIKDFLDTLDKLVSETYAGLLKSHSIFEALFIVIVVAVVPALCEETFFRGFVQKSFELKIKPIFAAALTAIFFALYHFNPYGLIALFALGLFFGFAAYKSGSIFVPLILHFLNNLIAIVAYFVLGEDEFLQSNVTDQASINSNLYLFIFFLTLFSVYIYLVIKNYSKIKDKKEPI